MDMKVFNFEDLMNSNYKFKDIFEKDFLRKKEFNCNNKLDGEGKPVNKKGEINSFSFAGDLSVIFELEENDFIEKNIIKL